MGGEERSEEKPSERVGLCFLLGGLSWREFPRRGKVEGTGELLGWSKQGRGVPTQSQEDQEQFPDASLNLEVKACPPSQVEAYSACHPQNPI